VYKGIDKATGETVAIKHVRAQHHVCLEYGNLKTDFILGTDRSRVERR